MIDFTAPRKRIQDNMLQAANEERGKSEAAFRELVGVLTEIARRADGERFQELKHSDPHIPDKWSPADWRVYFSSVSFSAWENVAIRPDSIVRDLRSQIVDLQARLKKSDELLVVERAKQQSTGAPSNETSSRQSNKSKPASSATPSNIFPISIKDSSAQSFTPSVADLVNETMKVFQLSPHVSAPTFTLTGGGRTGDDLARAFQRYYSTLYLVGHQRLAAIMEIESILQLVSGGKGAGSLKRAIEDLYGNFIQADVLTMEEPRTSLKLLRLKPEGERLFETVFGCKPVENEWSRLIRLDGEQLPRHTLAVIVFAVHARKRGYAVQVRPDTGRQDVTADALISRDGSTYFIDVEADEKNCIPKLEKQAALNNGKAAFCAATLAARASITKQCQAKGIQGFATDIETLLITSKYDAITPQHQLWQQEW